MVTDALLNWLGDVFDMMLGALPVIEPPDWFNGAAGMFATVFGFANSMGAWIPLALTVTVGGALIAAWLLAYGIHVARMVVSHLTGGGGSV